jgi:3-oxoacyl-[acyl-carrier-protein] synthase II
MGDPATCGRRDVCAPARLSVPQVNDSVRSMRERVVATGIGCISPFGTGHRVFSKALLDGASAIAPVRAFSTVDCRCRVACELRDFKPGDYIDAAKLRRIDDVGRLAIAATRLALDDARLEPNSDAIGVVVGSSTAGMHSTLPYLFGMARSGALGVSALAFPNTVANAAGSQAALDLGLRGPNVSFSQKEASSLAAIAYSVGLLRHRRASALVSGGVDDLEEWYFKIHDRFRVMSPTDEGESGSRPFDLARNGFVLGVGGFLFVLEAEPAARDRGADTYGEILGIGVTGSPCPLNAWPADPSGLSRAMRLAIDDAGLVAGDVDVVFASANSTKTLDALEAAALGEVFGVATVPVTSLKGAIGECGSSGAASLVGALLCLADGWVPPTAGFRLPDPACPVNVSAAPRRTDGRVALINSFASGGTNYSLVVRAGRASATGL